MSALLNAFSARQLAELKVGDHLCWFYESEGEHRAVLTQFLRDGLRQGQKVLYILHTHSPAVVLDYLYDQLNVGDYLVSGQLKLVESGGAYLDGGRFQPEVMIRRLAEETDRALAEGYTALRVTGETSWVQALEHAERFIEYESRVNDFLARSACIGLCQYRRGDLQTPSPMGGLLAHPTVIVGTQVYANRYYIPPIQFLQPDICQAILRQWLEELPGPRATARPAEEERFSLLMDALARTSPPTS